MNLLELRKRQRLSFALEIEHLSSDHSASTRRLHELCYDTPRLGFRECSCTTSGRSGRERNHRQTSDGRSPSIKLSVHSRTATPNVVVVHAGEIVVHERVRVHDLDCRTKQRGVMLAARGAKRRHEQNAAKSFTATEERITNGFGNAWRSAIEVRELLIASGGERDVDAAAMRFDFGDDDRVEVAGDRAISHVSP